MKKKIATLGVLTMSILVILIGVSLAHFTSSDSVTNVFNTGDIQAEPYEPEFEPPNNWGGSEYPKEVQVKNTGKNDCLVRVSITPRWVDSAGNPWAGDVNKVKLNFNTDNLIDPPTSSGWGAKKWMQGNDKYYYYTSILPVYKKDIKDEDGLEVGLTTELLSSVELVGEIPQEYQDKTLKIDVKVEAVQTTQNAYDTVWDMDLAGTNISSLLWSITSNNQ